jgi:LPXTG-motif cell wall-anchored protein
MVCTATYVVTAQDMTTEAITNTAVATGTVGPVQALTFTADAIAPGTTVSSQASTARVTVEAPTSPGGGSGSGGTGTGSGSGGLSSTGSNVISLITIAGLLLLVGGAVLSIGRKRRHG